MKSILIACLVTLCFTAVVAETVRSQLEGNLLLEKILPKKNSDLEYIDEILMRFIKGARLDKYMNGAEKCFENTETLIKEFTTADNNLSHAKTEDEYNTALFTLFEKFNLVNPWTVTCYNSVEGGIETFSDYVDEWSSGLQYLEAFGQNALSQLLKVKKIYSNIMTCISSDQMLPCVAEQVGITVRIFFDIQPEDDLYNSPLKAGREEDRKNDKKNDKNDIGFTDKNCEIGEALDGMWEFLEGFSSKAKIFNTEESKQCIIDFKKIYAHTHEFAHKMDNAETDVKFLVKESVISMSKYFDFIHPIAVDCMSANDQIMESLAPFVNQINKDAFKVAKDLGPKIGLIYTDIFNALTKKNFREVGESMGDVFAKIFILEE
jgi:hypothetical protein